MCYSCQKQWRAPPGYKTPYSSHTVTARYLQCIATNDGSSLQNPACPTWVSMVEEGDNNMHLFCISFYSITTRLHRMGGGWGGKSFLKNTTPLVHSPKQLVKQLIWWIKPQFFFLLPIVNNGRRLKFKQLSPTEASQVFSGIVESICPTQQWRDWGNHLYMPSDTARTCL